MQIINLKKKIKKASPSSFKKKKKCPQQLPFSGPDS